MRVTPCGVAMCLALSSLVACAEITSPSPLAGIDMSADSAFDVEPSADMPARDQTQDTPADQTTRPPPSCGAQDVCGQLCVDLQSDPTNCGSCGRTCVLSNATARCSDGECAISQCDNGFFDEDKDFTNGCESQNNCQSDAPCMTSCDSEGTTMCTDGKPSCVAPVEVCNGRDDDCNGQCDENQAGCRGGIHRGRGNGHIYSNSTSDLPVVEANNYFYLYQIDPQGNSNVVFKPVYLCSKPNGKKFITQSTNCEINRAPDKQLGFWATSEACGAIPLYRLYHPGQENHFYTTSANERDNAANNLGYNFERIAGYVWPRQ